MQRNHCYKLSHSGINCDSQSLVMNKSKCTAKLMENAKESLLQTSSFRNKLWQSVISHELLISRLGLRYLEQSRSPTEVQWSQFYVHLYVIDCK